MFFIKKKKQPNHTNRDAILEELDLLIGLLSTPTTEEEKKRGWTDDIKAGLHKHFSEVKTNIMNNEPTGYKGGLVRTLDYFGLVWNEDELTSKCLAMSNKLVDSKL